MYLTQSLHRAVQQAPERPWTVFGDRTRTVLASAMRVARLAGALRSLGVGAGDRVGMLALNSDRYHEYLLATWWAGGVVTPVNTRWSPAEIAYSLEESATGVLLVDDTFAPLMPELRDRAPVLRTVVHCGENPPADGMLAFEDLIEGANPIDDTRRGGQDLAGIFYTGGTTGYPKGVMLSHAGIITSALGSQATTPFVAPGGRMVLVAPMFHLAALAVWNSQNLIGGTAIMLPAFDPVTMMTTIQDHRADSTLLVPAMIQAMAYHPRAAEFDLSSMRRIVYGTSPIAEAVLRQAMTVFAQADFVQGYGMTELSPTATVLTPQDHRDGRLRSAGRATANAEVSIVDPDDNEVPRGTVGEIVVRGGHVMLGYWEKPEETATALRGGWMHTGDAAYMDDDGYVYIVDRIKDMIVTGGENVYSAEVENAMAHHPAIAACAVIGVPDPDWGERVHAVIVTRPGASTTAEEIREHVKAHIAGYKAPRTVEFVEALPMSAAGKVLKGELRKPYWEGRDRAIS